MIGEEAEAAQTGAIKVNFNISNCKCAKHVVDK